MKIVEARIPILTSLVEKINEMGQQVHDLAKKAPGISWAAELGELALSDNKYIRAAQILGTVMGGVSAPISVMVLFKRILSGGEKSERALELLQDHVGDLSSKIMEATAQVNQMSAGRAASFPRIKNPELQARLIRVSQSIRLLDSMRIVANYDGQMAIRQLQSLQDKTDNLLQVMDAEAELEAWVQAKLTKSEDYLDVVHDYLMAAMGVDTKVAEFEETDEEREEDEGEDKEAILPALGGLALRTLAPAAISTMMSSGDNQGQTQASSEDENEDEDEDAEACGMDDGSYPAGPRNEPNRSRYKVEPGHGQSTVDLLRFTAHFEDIASRIENIANG